MSIYAPSFYKPSDADYVPKRREISAVTNAIEPTITTTENHEYNVGQLLRIHVDRKYGMAIRGKKATVLTIPTDTTFTVDFDTSQLDTYVTPTYSDGDGFTESHCVPITGTVDNTAT